MNEHDTRRPSPLGSMLYFLAGSVAGAGVALLLAPQSGRATREMMRRRANDTAVTARELKDRLIRRSQHVRDEARHRVEGAVSALGGDGSTKLSG